VPALTPCPIPAALPFLDAVTRAPWGASLGIWLSSRRPLSVVAISGGQQRILLIDGDLGRLLRRCTSILVRVGADAVVVSADELIRVRALRVVAGLPYVPTSSRSTSPAHSVSHLLCSEAHAAPVGVYIPLGYRSAEEVLAAYAAARVPVLFSQVVYGRVAADRDRAVDSAPGQRLG